MIALPYSPPATSAAATAFVYEGDRMSGRFRLPNSAPPFTRSGAAIAVTNHYLHYGYDPAFPFRNFGVDILNPRAPGGDFSTLWRYAALSAALVARDDAAAQSADRAGGRGGITFDDVRSMLQGTASAICRARNKRFETSICYVTPLNRMRIAPSNRPPTPAFPSRSPAFSATCHGTTEHSIITRVCQGQPELWLAVADMGNGGWNAPYSPYTLFKWREMFP
jgi:hypothetical protein